MWEIWEKEIINRLGNTSLIMLIIISILFLLMSKDDRKRYLMGWPIIIMFIFLNPLILGLIGDNDKFSIRFFRLTWYLPLILYCIIAITDFVYNQKNQLVKWIGVFLLLIIYFARPVNHVIIYESEEGILYRMKPEDIEIAKIIEAENNKETFVIWSSSHNEYLLRQYLPNAKNIYIDSYLVAEKKSQDQIYGNKYKSFQIINNTDDEEKLARELSSFDVKYYILEKGENYEFLLKYSSCELIGETQNYRVFRVG